MARASVCIVGSAKYFSFFESVHAVRTQMVIEVVKI